MKKLAFAVMAISLGISLIGCNKESKPSNNPGGEEVNLFDEINEKVDIAQRSFGSLTSSAPVSRSVVNRDHNYGHTGEPWNEPPFYVYQESDAPSFVNKQQQMLYIISIVNYIREHLVDGSYGVEFKYNTLYEGEGFMETLKQLNEPLLLFNGPTPVLQVRYTHGEGWLGFESNWDYQSDFMKAGNEYWNIRILSKVKFVFNSQQKIKQIWVNYAFDGGLAYGCSTCLFDYEDEYFYTFYSGNSTSEMVEYTDPDMILAGYNKINSGLATSDNLVFANNAEAAKARLTTNSSAQDYEGYKRWLNRTDYTDIDKYFSDWSDDVETGETKRKFNELYDSVYTKLCGFTLLTEYEGEAEVTINELINDAANYAFWRSVFVYDSVNNTTYIPFLEREELVKYMGDLKGTNGGDFDADLDNILASQQAGEAKYIGNYFENGADKYELALAEDAVQLWEDNLITFGCEGRFTYKLKKNGATLLYFMIENGSAIQVNE